MHIIYFWKTADDVERKLSKLIHACQSYSLPKLWRILDTLYFNTPLMLQKPKDEVHLMGVATGGISVYIPPKSVTVLFTCGTLTHVLKLQWLVKMYTHPNPLVHLPRNSGLQTDVAQGCEIYTKVVMINIRHTQCGKRIIIIIIINEYY